MIKEMFKRCNKLKIAGLTTIGILSLALAGLSYNAGDGAITIISHLSDGIASDAILLMICNIKNN